MTKIILSVVYGIEVTSDDDEVSFARTRNVIEIVPVTADHLCVYSSYGSRWRGLRLVARLLFRGGTL